MDRCHRIGQQKPVLVLRLATSHSVEGRLLKRARSKLALERLVIKKGAFLHQEVRAAAGHAACMGRIPVWSLLALHAQINAESFHVLCPNIAGCVRRTSSMAQGAQEDTKTSMKAEELVEILKGEGDRAEKDLAQSGVISEEVGDSNFRLYCDVTLCCTVWHDHVHLHTRDDTSDTSMQMLEKLLDRSHLEKHIKAPYPDVGVGYEMVQANDGSGLLSGVE